MSATTAFALWAASEPLSDWRRGSRPAPWALACEFGRHACAGLGAGFVL